MSRGLLPRRIPSLAPILAAVCAVFLSSTAFAQMRQYNNSNVLGGNDATACATAAGSGDTSDRAIELCDASLGNNVRGVPRVTALTNRGAIRMARREYPAALADFDAAIAVNDRSAQAHYNRGVVLLLLDQPGQAVAALTEALTLGVPEPFRAYYNRAAAREALGDVQGAYEDYTTSLEIQPDWGPANEERARFVRNRRETLSAELSGTPRP